MSVDRRTALKGLVAGAVGVAAAGAPALARERRRAPDDAAGMLYDATRCVGCKACVYACKKANDLPPETENVPGGLYDAPVDLSARTKNVIKAARLGARTSFVKAQCMHCIDPACASVCMMAALRKTRWGVVTYDVSRCVGCRYCQVACQFNVPRFEWDSPVPRIVKCEMCRPRLEQGLIPACCEVCPRDAVIFGPRATLLTDARQRIADHPDRYEPKIYGEHDAGGTQVLYLSARGFPFEKLGLPDVGDEPVPELAETIQHGIYRGFIAPVALYAALGVVLYRNRQRERSPGDPVAGKTDGDGAGSGPARAGEVER